MKTTSRVITAMAITGLFMTASAMAQAQSIDPTPAWTTSKDVQKVANKKMFNDENLKESHIRVSSVLPTWNISKGIHRRTGEEARANGNVVSKEYPTWLISKGVQQIGRK